MILLFTFAINFLCSIHFRLDYYILTLEIQSDEYEFFKKNKSNYLNIKNHIGNFINENPDFFEDYSPYCTTDKEGLIFFKNSLLYPNNKITYPINSISWEETRECLYIFSKNQCVSMHFDEKYPKYIIFSDGEISSKRLVYSPNGRPNGLIDDFWDEYEYVKVVRFEKQWYLIEPIGQK